MTKQEAINLIKWLDAYASEYTGHTGFYNSTATKVGIEKMVEETNSFDFSMPKQPATASDTAMLKEYIHSSKNEIFHEINFATTAIEKLRKDMMKQFGRIMLLITVQALLFAAAIYFRG